MSVAPHPHQNNSWQPKISLYVATCPLDGKTALIGNHGGNEILGSSWNGEESCKGWDTKRGKVFIGSGHVWSLSQSGWGVGRSPTARTEEWAEVRKCSYWGGGVFFKDPWLWGRSYILYWRHVHCILFNEKIWVPLCFCVWNKTSINFSVCVCCVYYRFMCALCYRFIFEYAKERCLGRHLANKLLTREGGRIRIRRWEAEVGIWSWVGYGAVGWRAFIFLYTFVLYEVK